MLLPLTGLICTTTIFAVIGIIVLRLTGIRPLRPLVLGAFVVAAQAGFVAFSASYGALFGGADNKLQSTTAVIGFLIGAPVLSALVGWVVARALAAWLARARPV